MQNDDFIFWLKGFIDGVDAEHKQVLEFSKSITISIDTWNKLKEKLDEVNKPVDEDSQATQTTTPVWSPTPVWYTTTSYPPGTTVTPTNGNLYTEDEKVL